MIQIIGPDMVGNDTYRIVEATMMNNANRIAGYDWYAAACQTGTAIPTKMQMRNYGRECALAYVLEGETITAAVTLATKLMYHRTYDDAKGYIKRTTGDRDRMIAVTSIVDTQSWAFDDEWDPALRGSFAARSRLQYRDNHGWFETADLIARLDLPDQEKQILSLIALGYSTKDIADQIGLKRTTLTMRLPKLMERIRETCLTALKAL
jgi:hypothetical protein